MAMPAVQELRRRRPEARLGVLARGGCAVLWRMHGAVDEVLEWKGKSVGEASRLVRAGEWDEAWVVPNSVRSALVPWRAGVPRRVGAKGHWPRSWLLTETRETGAGEGVHQSVEVARLFFGEDVALELPRLEAPESARTRVREWLAGARRPWVAMVPGAARGASKQWPMERYAETAKRVCAATGGTAVMLGTAGEAPLCEAVREAAGTGAETASLAGRTSLEELSAALQEANAVVCNDSGGMHLAAALGTPTVAVFGITNPAQTGPLGERVTVLQHSEKKARAVPRVSPEAEAALRRVTAEEASAAVLRWLGS
jgi:heptosyltransferase-2